MIARRRLVSRWLPAVALGAAVSVGGTAHAFDFALRLEPGIAVPLAEPQSTYFGVGGAASLKGAASVGGYVDLQLGLLFAGVPAKADAPSSEPATMFGVGGGVRVKRPHGRGRVSPWLDGDALYLRTGPLDRFAFAVAAGVSFPVGEARAVWLGPFVRYLQVLQPDRPGKDNADAKLLVAGVTIEAGSSYRIAPLVEDRDGDGVPDERDRCPDAAEDRDGFEDADGCPDPDNDRDGIPDAADRCPNDAEDKDGFEDADGCPDPDNDGDGLADAVDKCPNEPEDKDGFEDNDGCPDPDNDKDGVPDKDDSCPNAFGPKETFGCPDRDLDGTPDAQDACPDVPGPRENQGCPMYKAIKVTKERIELSQKIFFAHDRTDVLPRSFPLLDEVVQALKDNQALKVRIEGHTDDRGGLAHNMQLSEGRAGAIMRYLVEHGIAAGRLSATGYGPSLPIDTNKTVDGREHNRRVEFVIVGEGGGAR